MASLNGVDISNIEDGNIKLFQAIRSIDANEKLNDVATSEKAVVTETFTVDASAGGVAQVTNLSLLPAESTLINVSAIVGVAFDGDTTTTLEVGVSGNADAFIDTVDFDPSAVAGTSACSLGGTTNDIKGAKYYATATQLIATWTNTANASAGEVVVEITYLKK